MAEAANGVRPLPVFPVQGENEEEFTFSGRVTDVTSQEFTYLNGCVEALRKNVEVMNGITERLQILSAGVAISPADFNMEASKYNEALERRSKLPIDMAGRAKHVLRGLTAVIKNIKAAEKGLSACVSHGLPGEVFTVTIPNRIAAVGAALETLRAQREEAKKFAVEFPRHAEAEFDATKGVEGRLNNDGHSLGKARKAANWMASWGWSAAAPAPIALKEIVDDFDGAASEEEEVPTDTSGGPNETAVVFGPRQKPADHVEAPAPTVVQKKDATDDVDAAAPQQTNSDAGVFKALAKGTAHARHPSGTYEVDGVTYDLDGNVLYTVDTTSEDVDEDGDRFLDAEGPKLGHFGRPKGEQSKMPYFDATGRVIDSEFKTTFGAAETMNR